MTTQTINLDSIGINPTKTVYISHFVFLLPIIYDTLQGLYNMLLWAACFLRVPTNSWLDIFKLILDPFTHT